MENQNQEQNQNQNEITNQHNDQTENISKISQSTTNVLISSILRKHGVTKDKLKPISEEQKAELRNMVENLKQQLTELQKQASQTYTENSQSSSKDKSPKINRRRRRL